MIAKPQFTPSKPTPAKAVIALESILLLISALATGTLLNKNYQIPFVHSNGNILIFFLIGLSAASVIMWLELRQRLTEPTRFFITTLALVLVIGLLTARQVQMRRSSTEPVNSNDGVVQTEEAAKFLWHGKNPYDVDYANTRFRFFFKPGTISGDKVAQTHYAYPPIIVLLAMPVVGINQVTGWRLDVQAWYMLFFLAWAAIVIFLPRHWRMRTRLALLTIGLPIIWFFPLAGFNDIVFIFWLTLGAWAVTRERWWLAGISVGLALASKQTAAVALPIWLLLIWAAPWTRVAKRRLLIAAGATAALIYGPFLIWNPWALYDDLLRYVGGMIPISYPISGVTFLQYLRVWGITNSPWAVFPSWWIQLPVSLAAFGLLVPIIKRQPTVNVWLGGTTFLLLIVTLFTRFGAENYYATILMLAITAYAFSLSSIEPQTNEV